MSTSTPVSKLPAVVQGAPHVGRLDRGGAAGRGAAVADQAEYLRVAVVLDLVTTAVDHAAGPGGRGCWTGSA